jgi:hypothetical protein
MTAPTRRQFFSLGLTAGTAALLARIGHAEADPADAADNMADCLAGQDGLRFRIRPGYQPDISAQAQQRLTRAILDFLLDTHPPDVTLSLWEKNPRDLPYLEQHIAAMVTAVHTGVETHLPKQPVDPVLVVAILYNESRFSPVVISPTGALGMAQFMPNTAIEYDLNPIAQLDLWQRYRDVKATERARRARHRKKFLKRFGIDDFSTTAVIQHALKTDKLDALAAYQELVNAEKPELDSLNDYIGAVREELAQLDFFVDGEETVGKIDARTRYAAATAAVDYIARRLAENSGMISSAVAAYNAGPAAVRDSNPRSVLYGYGELPAYPETVRYLQRVLVVYSKLRDHLA